MTNLQKQIQNHKWEKCNCENGFAPEYVNNGEDMIMTRCEICQGSGFEPIEIENPIINFAENCEGDYIADVQYKEGEIIEIPFKKEINIKLSDKGLKELLDLKNKLKSIIEPTITLNPQKAIFGGTKKFQIVKIHNKTGWGIIPVGGK